MPASAAAAFGFLATVIKDYGGTAYFLTLCGCFGLLTFLTHAHTAVEESTQLYLKALALKPQSSSYALNLIHGLEVFHANANENATQRNALLTCGLHVD